MEGSESVGAPRGSGLPRAEAIHHTVVKPSEEIKVSARGSGYPGAFALRPQACSPFNRWGSGVVVPAGGPGRPACTLLRRRRRAGRPLAGDFEPLGATPFTRWPPGTVHCVRRAPPPPDSFR